MQINIGKLYKPFKGDDASCSYIYRIRAIAGILATLTALQTLKKHTERKIAIFWGAAA
jgi:hypothetical protein